TTAYTYHGTSNRVHTVSQSDGTAMTLTYDAQNRVKTLMDGESNVTEYFYDDANTTRVVIGGQTTTYRFDTNERLLSKEGVANHQIIKTEYGYYADDTMHPGKLAWMKDGLGNQVNYTYDARGNQLTQTDGEGRVVTKTYNSANLLETETLGDSTTHYIYNGYNHLRYIVDGEGGVTEFRYNALHQRTSQHIYTQAFSGAEVTGVKLNEWVLSLDKSAQQLTEYAYDFRGQLQSRTTYSDVTREGTGTGTNNTTQYVYDVHGNLLQETMANGRSSTLTYDGLGRVLTKTDANQAQTSFIYNDATQTISTRYANGLWETQTLDKTGALVSLAKGAGQGASELGVERIYRDAQGRAVATEDAEGARSYVLYDDAGRKRFTVDALGA
ncbi:hypothetical protein L1286_24045, partial [Pseudoalteromonas sp. SMS1]|uniref:hypothetical protein n=1 Tax=Pseudoalteromonas sp. SMS1 TaxID=2908894 RepID=UPI001F1C5BC8